MSNSFNISVKPEIAAAVVKIDENKAVIDNIHDTDLPAVKSVVDSNDTIISNIHDTDLPAVDTKLTTLDTVCDNIRNIDVPTIQTDIGNLNNLSVAAIPTTILIASDTPIILNTDEVSTVETVYTKVIEIQVYFASTIRVYFGLKTATAGQTAAGRIYVDGAFVGSPRSSVIEAYTYWSEDIALTIDQLLQLYLKTGNASYAAYAKDFQVRGAPQPFGINMAV
ncbi:hypothetical protein ES705_23379 [subsurface metagenome]